jgi:Ceramidase
MIGLLGVVAGSDCERIRDGLVAQPANAASSLTYVLVGAGILVRVVRRDVRRGEAGVALGLAAIGLGIGSIAFHGPDGSLGRFVHDLSIAVALIVIAASDLALLGRPARLPAILAAGATATILAVAPDAANAVSVALALAVAALELLVLRGPARMGARTVPEALRVRISRLHRVAYSVALGALAVGAAVNLLGRTNASLCGPDSLWQPHALWHVLTAVALGACSIPALDRLPRAITAPAVDD